MPQPLVSVVMPVRNRARWVRRAIESVFAQTYEKLELLVVDDGSTDETPAVLRSYADSLSIFTLPHVGPYRARNYAIERARGDLIAFIDSDDLWFPDKLERQIPLFERRGIGLVFGDAVLVDHSASPPVELATTFFDNAPPSRGQVAARFAYSNFVPFSSVIVRRSCFEDVGGFAPTLSADHVKWFEIALRYELDYVPTPVFAYALHADGISRDICASLRARIEAFAEILTQADGETARLIKHILFNLRLQLALAELRRGKLPRTGYSANPSDNPPFADRLLWLLSFSGYQASLRLRRKVRQIARAL